MKRLLLSDELPERAGRAFIIWLIRHAGKMKRILRSDWLPEREKWAHLARLGLSALVPQEKLSFRPYNKSIIYKACSAFVYVFIDLDSVSVNKNSKKELGQYPAILTSHLKYYIKSKIFSFLHVIDSATLCTLKVRVFSFPANVCSGPYFTSHDPCA